MFVPAIVGSRIWFVLDHWAIYRHDLRRIWRHSDGGMTLYGGLVLTLVLSPVILAPPGLRFAAFWDGATFTILVGMVFTRVGCLLNGCCSGRRNDGRLGLWLPDHTGRWQRRYPVQLLELASALVLLGGSATLLAVGVPRGTIFVFALVSYAAARFAIDPCGNDRRMPPSGAQWLWRHSSPARCWRPRLAGSRQGAEARLAALARLRLNCPAARRERARLFTLHELARGLRHRRWAALST